ncbi:hypothetical protein CZ814_03673 [Photobacterium toruni]|uniref:Uncharacterized protein n=1 Tax=Photobacterium toruni TaxID=1935446 RepID=A0A1T4USV0_9GAMM|nr:hypothetical protein CZ814_03673 [Photobacterium toruni]
MIKLSLLVCGLLTATSICAAESTQVNYYQDAHGNFIGYTPATYNQLENGSEVETLADLLPLELINEACLYVD